MTDRQSLWTTWSRPEDYSKEQQQQQQQPQYQQQRHQRQQQQQQSTIRASRSDSLDDDLPIYRVRSDPSIESPLLPFPSGLPPAVPGGRRGGDSLWRIDTPAGGGGYGGSVDNVSQSERSTFACTRSAPKANTSGLATENSDELSWELPDEESASLDGSSESPTTVDPDAGWTILPAVATPTAVTATVAGAVTSVKDRRESMTVYDDHDARSLPNAVFNRRRSHASFEPLYDSPSVTPRRIEDNYDTRSTSEFQSSEYACSDSSSPERQSPSCILRRSFCGQMNESFHYEEDSAAQHPMHSRPHRQQVIDDIQELNKEQDRERKEAILNQFSMSLATYLLMNRNQTPPPSYQVKKGEIDLAFLDRVLELGLFGPASPTNHRGSFSAVDSALSSRRSDHREETLRGGRASWETSLASPSSQPHRDHPGTDAGEHGKQRTAGDDRLVRGDLRHQQQQQQLQQLQQQQLFLLQQQQQQQQRQQNSRRPMRSIDANEAALERIDLEARLRRSSAQQRVPTRSWSGTLKAPNHASPTYANKVFLGGLPYDATVESLENLFRGYGVLSIQIRARGHAYLVFDDNSRIRPFLQCCENDQPGQYFYYVPSKRGRGRLAQVIPWALEDREWPLATARVPGGADVSAAERSEWGAPSTGAPGSADDVAGELSQLENAGRGRGPGGRVLRTAFRQNTVFVGALHGEITAEGLQQVFSDLFGPVVYVGIDSDKNRYPNGSARVTFKTATAFREAVLAEFVQIVTPRFTKTVQLDAYIEGGVCSVRGCGVATSVFCRHPSCFRYYCGLCFEAHRQLGPDDSTVTMSGPDYHPPVMRNRTPSTTGASNGNAAIGNNSSSGVGGGGYGHSSPSSSSPFSAWNSNAYVSRFDDFKERATLTERLRTDYYHLNRINSDNNSDNHNRNRNNNGNNDNNDIHDNDNNVDDDYIVNNNNNRNNNSNIRRKQGDNVNRNDNRPANSGHGNRSAKTRDHDKNFDYDGNYDEYDYSANTVSSQYHRRNSHQNNRINNSTNNNNNDSNNNNNNNNNNNGNSSNSEQDDDDDDSNNNSNNHRGNDNSYSNNRRIQSQLRSHSLTSPATPPLLSSASLLLLSMMAEEQKQRLRSD